MSRTGVIRTEDLPLPPKEMPEEIERRREPPAPPTLPEVNQDDGSTTGVIHFNSEGKDRAAREKHPRQQ